MGTTTDLTSASADAEVVIAAGVRAAWWSELTQARELLLFLAWRDLLVRYRQTAVGVLWVVLRPGLTAAILAVVFGRIAGLVSPDPGVPFWLVVLAGAVAWQFIANVIQECSVSITGNAGLVTKTAFCRLTLPLASVLINLVDLAVGLGVVLVCLAACGRAPGWTLLAAPLAVLPAVAAALGTGLWMAAAMVRWRDVRNLVPFVLQAGLLASPVGFTGSHVPEMWRTVTALNPAAAAIDLLRWSLFGSLHAPDPAAIAIGCTVAMTLLVSGLWFFRRQEAGFADVI